MNAYRLIFILTLMVTNLPMSGQDSYVTITEKTSLRARNTSNSKSLVRLSVNDELKFIGDCNQHYCKVDFNGRIGWVKRRLLIDISEKNKKQPQNGIKSDSRKELSGIISKDNSDDSQFEHEVAYKERGFSLYFCGIITLCIFFLFHKTYGLILTKKVKDKRFKKNYREEQLSFRENFNFWAIAFCIILGIVYSILNGLFK